MERERTLFRYIAFVTTSGGDKDKLSTGAKSGEREKKSRIVIKINPDSRVKKGSKLSG